MDRIPVREPIKPGAALNGGEERAGELILAGGDALAASHAAEEIFNPVKQPMMLRLGSVVTPSALFYQMLERSSGAIDKSQRLDFRQI